MPKKKQVNAFFIFMLELRSREEAKGNKLRSMDDLKDRAGLLWEKMDKAARAPYVEKAAATKLDAKDANDKMTIVGLSYATVEAEKNDNETKRKFITDRVTSMVEKAVEKKELTKLSVFFVAFEYFCELPNGRFIPAEMAAIRYTLEDGVMDKMHTAIDPGSLPLGYALDAQSHSEINHKLPIPPDAIGEKNYETIALKLLEFLSKNGAEMPLLFTNEAELPMVEGMLEDIMQGIDSDFEILVCPLSHLFYRLKRSACRALSGPASAIPTIHSLQALIDKDVYDFTANISCEFHEEQGNGKYCALSRCVRWAYIISDCCCADLQIPMKRGKHLPARADVTIRVVTNELDDLSLSSTACDESTVLSCSFSDAASMCSRSTNPWAGAAGTSTVRVDNQPEIQPVRIGGRGTRLKLDASNSGVVRREIRDAGRGKKLNMYDFPPLGASDFSFK